MTICYYFISLAIIATSSDYSLAQGTSKQSQFNIRLKTNIDPNVAKRVGGRIDLRINNRIERTTSINIDQDVSRQNFNSFVKK